MFHFWKQFPLIRNKKALTFIRALVPRAGIEPALPKEQDFESSASTSSATEAFIRTANFRLAIAKILILLNSQTEK